LSPDTRVPGRAYKRPVQLSGSFFYRRLSSLLQQAIDDYRAERINEAQYLLQVTAVMDEVRGGHARDVPAVVRQSDLARAFFGSLKEQMGLALAGDNLTGLKAAETGPWQPDEVPAGSLPNDDALAEAAVAMEQIIRRHAVVRWRDNMDAQNRMKNDLDDYLYALQQQHRLSLNFTQMDAIIDAVLRIARHRPDDL